MSLKGPLFQRKQYMKDILQSHDFKLRDVRTKYTGSTFTIYEFIWDTPNSDPQLDRIQNLKKHIEGFDFLPVMMSLQSIQVVSRTGPKSFTYKYRHTADVEVVPVGE